MIMILEASYDFQAILYRIKSKATKGRVVRHGTILDRPALSRSGTQEAKSSDYVKPEHMHLKPGNQSINRSKTHKLQYD
jgi:hypothetical protein